MRCLRFFTRLRIGCQSMALQACPGATAPMSKSTLSFTVVKFLYLAVSVKMCEKWAVFRPGVTLKPLFLALPKTFACSRFFYPLDNSVAFTVDLLKNPESPLGLPCSVHLTHDDSGFCLGSAGDVVRSILKRTRQNPTQLPFGSSVSA